jgi:NAD(P)H-hydrate repair Nnr-like enzyme with NAD(P)H-hydrate epimerase domain
LSLKNAHQRPRVVVLVGEHLQGAMALSCARQLASHQVTVTVFTAPELVATQAYTQVHNLLRLLAYEDNVSITRQVSGK